MKEPHSCEGVDQCESGSCHRLIEHRSGDWGAPNKMWAMDFVHDQLSTGRKIRPLTVDAYTGYALAIVPHQFQGGERGRGARHGLRGARVTSDDPSRSLRNRPSSQLTPTCRQSMY